MRNKRRLDTTWEIRQYDADLSLYAHCKCGFQYACSQSVRDDDGSWSAKQAIKPLYHYCPNCGSRKKWQSDEIIRMHKYPWEA